MPVIIVLIVILKMIVTMLNKLHSSLNQIHQLNLDIIVTYSELLHDVKKFANVLKKHGVKKGDRVTIYMPMVT